MEHEMKLSPVAVRQSRLERGWSQEQLATAAGLSLRTVQRVEAVGIASLETAASLAATFNMPLLHLQLQAGPPATPPTQPSWVIHGMFFIGLALLTVSSLTLFVSSLVVRSPDDPLPAFFMAANLATLLLAVSLAGAAGRRLWRARQQRGALLALLGVPMVTMLGYGVLTSTLLRNPPSGTLLGLGALGTGLLALSLREFRRVRSTA